MSDRWLRMRVGHVRISATGARRSPATDVRCSSHLILLAEGCVSRTRPLDPPRSNFAAAPAHQIRRAPPTNSAPLVGARRVSDEGPALAELGNRGRKTGVKDEAPPLARRRVGSGLSGFVALSFLACGGGVSFRFCCTCGARCRSGSLWGLVVSGTCGAPLAVRVLFGVVSFAGRGRCAFGVARSVSLLCAERAGAPSRRTVAEAGSFHPAGDHRGAGVGAEPQRWASGAAANTRRVTTIIAERCRRGAVECFSRNAVIVTHRGGTLARRGSPRATGQFNRGSVAPGKAHWVDPQLGDVLPSPACSTQPGTNLAGGNRLVPLQRSWGLEHPRQGQHLPGRGLPPQVRASLLPQALTRRTFSRCRTHHC